MSHEEQIIELLGRAKAEDVTAFELLAEQYSAAVLTTSEKLLVKLGEEGNRKETFMAALSALYSIILDPTVSSKLSLEIMLAADMDDYAGEAYTQIIAYRDIPLDILCAKAEEGDELAKMLLAFQDVEFPADNTKPPEIKKAAGNDVISKIEVAIGNLLSKLTPTIPVTEGDGTMCLHFSVNLPNINKGRNKQ